MTNVAISLLSGGLDSTIVTSYALKYANDLTAITFDYGQSHGREINSAKNITSLLNVKHKLIELPFFKQSAWYSALTNPDTFPISKSTHDREIGKKIPLTYVPLRNTIFLSIAAGLLESIILKKIELGKSDITDITASIYLGPNIVDFSGYPDCKPEFFSQISETIRMGSKSKYKLLYSICLRVKLFDSVWNWDHQYPALGAVTLEKNCHVIYAKVAN